MTNFGQMSPVSKLTTIPTSTTGAPPTHSQHNLFLLVCGRELTYIVVRATTLFIRYYVDA